MVTDNETVEKMQLRVSFSRNGRTGSSVNTVDGKINKVTDANIRQAVRQTDRLGSNKTDRQTDRKSLKKRSWQVS